MVTREEGLPSPGALTATGPDTVTIGQNAPANARLTTGPGDTLVGRTVSLQAQKAGSTTWTTVGHGRTSGIGTISPTTRPAASGGRALSLPPAPSRRREHPA
jgi:hypothetical protein